MQFPAVTALYSGFLALLFVGLSVHVVVLRGRSGIVHGDGGHDLLNRTIRAHANFAEHVPFALFLAALAEAAGSAQSTIHMLLGPLTVARLMHPIGMRQQVGSVRQYAWRASSVTITWLVLAAAGVLVIAAGLSSLRG